MKVNHAAGKEIVIHDQREAPELFEAALRANEAARTKAATKPPAVAADVKKMAHTAPPRESAVVPALEVIPTVDAPRLAQAKSPDSVPKQAATEPPASDPQLQEYELRPKLTMEEASVLQQAPFLRHCITLLEWQTAARREDREEVRRLVAELNQGDQGMAQLRRENRATLEENSQLRQQLERRATETRDTAPPTRKRRRDNRDYLAYAPRGGRGKGAMSKTGAGRDTGEADTMWCAYCRRASHNEATCWFKQPRPDRA